MAAQRCKRPINLFRKHGARQFMWESHGGKREQQIRSRLPFRWQPIVSAHQKDEIAAFCFGSLHKARKCRRVERLARWIKKHLLRGRVLAKKIEAPKYELPHFAIGIAGRALQELGCDGVRMLVAHFAKVV